MALAAVLTAAAGVGGVSLGGCGGAQTVSGWVSSNQLGAWIGTLEADNDRIATVVREDRGPSVVYSDCALLIADLGNSPAGDLPTPDAELTDDLDKAFRAEEAAGNACADGAHGDQSLLSRSAAERNEATVLFTAALERVMALTGRSPSTSTTISSQASADS